MNENIVAYLIAYLIGAIPFGLLIVKAKTGIDIREHGSGSIGATNVLRVLESRGVSGAKKFGVITILCDALKGLLPIIVAGFLGFDERVLWMMGVLGVVGHCFSPFLKFEGGKGVATSFGVFLAFLPIEAVISIAVWLGVGKFLKISSLASMAGILCFVILSFLIHPNMPINTHAPIIIIAVLVFYKHIPNIKRLIFKEEAKVI